MAIGARTNVAIESADLVLIEDDPLDAVKALNIFKQHCFQDVKTQYGFSTTPRIAWVLSQ